MNELLDKYDSDFGNNELDDSSVSKKLNFALRQAINDRVIKELRDYLNCKLINIYKEIRDLETYSYNMVNDSILISEAIGIMSSDASIDNLYQEHYDVIDSLFKNDFTFGNFSKYEMMKIKGVYKTYTKLKD